VESALLLATSLLEPLIICLFGVIITCLVLAIYWPVFTVSSGVN
jgi:type II secretory pathway component PulF